MCGHIGAHLVCRTVRCGSARFPSRPRRSIPRVSALDDRGGENTYRSRIGSNFCHELFHKTRCRYLVLLKSRTLYLWRENLIGGINRE
jgi:hypothetical protein